MNCQCVISNLGWEYEQTEQGAHLPVYRLEDWQRPQQQFQRRMGHHQEDEQPQVRQRQQQQKQWNPYVMDSRIKI